MTGSAAVRYALAPACIGLAVLLHVSPVGPLFHPMGLFILGVVAAAWFGGAGPGVFAAFLSAILLPHLIAITYPLSVAYPLLAAWFDLPRFVTLGLTGAAVGWGTSAYRRVRDQQETTVAERTAHLAASEERHERAMLAAEAGFWDWDVPSDEYHVSPKLLEMAGFAPGTTFSSRADHLQRAPFHPEDRDKWQRAVKELFAGTGQRLSMEVRVIVNGQTRWQSLSGICVRDASGKVVRWSGSSTDVTERKRAEDALRESEKRYERVMHASEDGFWEWVVASDEFYASPRMLALYGLPPDTVFRGRKDFMSCFPFHPEDLESWRKAVAAHLAGQIPRVDLEVRAILKDGAGWIHLTGICLRDASGAEERWTGSVSDVTARRRAQEALRASEQRYSLAMEASEEGHFDVNLDTDEHFTSERLNEIHGFPSSTRTAKRSEFIEHVRFYGDDAEKFHAAIAAAEAKDGPERYEFEVRIVRPSGEVRWLRTRGKVMRDAEGRARRRTGVVADITERKLGAEALRDSEARFRALAESALAGIYLIQENRFRYVNPAMATMFGYTPEDLVDRLGPADLVHPDDRALVAENIRRRVEREVDEIRYEFRGVRRDGSVFPVEVHGRRIEFGGKPGVMGALVDNTERKRAEEALRLSESRYAGALEAAEEGHFDVKYDTNEHFYSERLYEIVGIAPGTRFANRAEALKQMRFYGSDAEIYLAGIRAVEARNGPDRYEFEFRIVRPSGEMRWLRTRGKVTRDAEGNIRRRTGVAVDITEAKLADEEVRVSEARFRGLTELLSDWYWEQDENLRFTYLSNQALHLTGYSGESSLGKTRWEIANMEPLSCSWQEHQQALAARQPFRDLECRRIGPDGTVRYLSMSGAPVFDEGGRFKGYQGIGRNITERKRAEEKLRESEALKSAMFETALDCIISMDHEGRVIEFNPAAERTFGYRRAEALGKELASLIIPPRLREQHRRGLARYLATGEGPVLGKRVEIPAVRADGAELPVELSVTRIPGEGAPLFTAYLRDITERKRAEEKVRESEARFRSLTEISSDWYWRQDENLRFTYLSAGVSERAGWPADDYLGRLRWEVPDIHPISFSWEEHKEVLAKRQPFRDLEYWRPGKDGLISYTSISGAPIFDEQGRFKGYQGVGRNISERKRIEEELRSRQEMLELAQESASAVAFEWRLAAEGPKRSRWSPGLAAMHGITAEDYDGSLKQYKKLIHPEDWPQVKEAIQRAQRTGEVAAEYRVLYRDGSVRWLQAKGRMLFDAAGKPARMVGFMHDVTERKRVDEALRQSEERYALAVAGSNEGIFDWDLVSDRVYVSHRAQELFGLPRGELWRPRRDWRHILSFHPDDAPKLHDSIKAHIEGGTPTYDVEFRIVLPGGGVRWFRQRGIALRDASGKAYRVVGSIGDVTEKHSVEEELKAVERKLRLAQRLEAMGTLAGGIAHDFNNILGAILGYGEMALRDAAKGSRLRRDLDSIVTAGERGRALVDRVLAFSRSGVGERVPVQVEKVVREALDLVSAKLPPDVTLHAKLHTGRAAMLGDATQVHQVLMNLATNAVQAMPAGGTLRVSLRALRLEAARAPAIGILDPGEYLVLEVSDTGTGIAPEILDRIFDPFFTTKEVGTGTGLGLSLVHGIVAEVGGAIDVASKVGAGATFTVYFPRAGDAAECEEEAEHALPRGEGQRVLVVDDEEPLVRLATRTLEELGYAPVGFTSSTKALAAFRADPLRFDALITDERMPGMSGSALIREVRGIRDGIPIMLMSGYVGGAIASRARDAGAAEVLKKPLSARELATSLARVLQP